MQARHFKTLKAVKRIYHAVPCGRDFRAAFKDARVSYWTKPVNKFDDARWQLGHIVHGLDDWSRKERKGRPIDAYLLEHAEGIRSAINEITNALDDLATDIENRNYEDASAVTELFRRARVSIADLWQLDLLEDEQHEIARRHPLPKVEAPTYATFRNMSPEQRTRALEELRTLVLALKADPTPGPGWLADVMTSSPMQRIAGGWS